MGGDRPKQFLELSGKPILAHTLNALARARVVSRIFLIVPAAFEETTRGIVSEWLASGAPAAKREVFIVAGGTERQDSVYNGLLRLPSECEWVLIHDGVRPFASPELIGAVWEGARASGACISAVPATDTVKRAAGGRVRETLARDEIWLVQTPQAFRKEILLEAYRKAIEGGWRGTDDASFVERIGVPVSIVAGERSNIKVTNPEDLRWAEWFLSGAMAKEGF